MMTTIFNRGRLISALSPFVWVNLSWAQPTSAPKAKSSAPPPSADVMSAPPKDASNQTPLKPQGPPPPPPRATIKCQPAELEIGAPVTCAIEVRHPETMSVQVLTPPNALKVTGDATASPDARELITKRSFELRHYQLDRPLRVKDLSVTWSAIGGHAGTVRLPDQKITVKESLVGVAQPRIRDLNNPLGVVSEGQGALSMSRTKRASKRAQAERAQGEAALEQARDLYWVRHAPPSLQQLSRTLVVLVGGIAVGILGVIVGWIIRRVSALLARDEGPYVDPRPAHEIALADLEELDRARLIEAEAYKPYSQRISEIMRAYFGRRYQFHGLEMTSDELRERLGVEELSAEAKLLLDHFLSDTDLIKFADLSGSAGISLSMRERAGRLVEITQDQVTEGADAELDELDPAPTAMSAQTQVSAQDTQDTRDPLEIAQAAAMLAYGPPSRDLEDVQTDEQELPSARDEGEEERS